MFFLSVTFESKHTITIMFKFLIKLFFKYFYKFKPPEAVKYGKTKGFGKAKVTKTDSGSVQMEIEGEKYPFPGFPRQHVLIGGSLEKVKSRLKKDIFHTLFEVMEDATPDIIPEEQFCPFVKEIWRTMTMMENAEVTEDMKSQIRNMKKVICFFMQEDDAWRFRVQWMMERMDKKKCELSKADIYYLRGKWFKPDLYTKGGNVKYEY